MHREMMAYLAIAVFGSVVGSFLNVCIYRLPRNLSLIFPGSFCPQCKKSIAWYDNIPLASYILLKGRCRHCRAAFSPRYLAVEAVTAVFFVLVQGLGRTQGYDLGRSVILAWVGCTLIVSTFVDLELWIIPDEITKVGMLFAPLASFAIPTLHAARPDWFGAERVNALVAALLGMAAGAGLVYCVGVMGKLVFKKDAMGFGDVKLMGFLGGLLGWQGIIVSFFLACFLGSIFGILIWLHTKNSRIPFGPYLSAGAMAMLLFGNKVQWIIFEAYPEWVSGLVGRWM